MLAALALLAACAKEPASLPEWNGVWIADGTERDIDGFTSLLSPEKGLIPPPLSLFNRTIPWNEDANGRLQKLFAATRGNPSNTARNADGWGYPLMMVGPAPLQFVHASGLTTIMNIYRDTRLIYTDGRGHLPAEEAWPATTWGDSVGHWEGDALVIETVGVREPNRYFSIAAPFSEKARYVERLRLVSRDRIEGELTVEDPQTLSKPLTVKLAYVRTTEIERIVLDGFTNDRSGWDGQFGTIENAAKTPSAQ